jgi:protein-S-isoprenylcysteine O-methyltransferase Ste14
MKDTASSPAADPRPASAVSHGVGIAGLIGLFVWLYIARNFGELASMIGYPGFPARADGPYSALIAAAFCGIPMLLWSVLRDKVHLRATTGLDWSLKRPVADVLDTSIIKIAGLWATWAMIACIYAVFRFYWGGTNFNFPFAMDMFQAAAIPLIIVSVPYVIWLDRYMVDPRDGSWHFGAWLAGRSDWDREQIFHHLRAWGVKGFFLAFMISIIPGGFQEIVNLNFTDDTGRGILTNPVWLSSKLISAMFLVDVQFATVGYLMTMKPFDAHIRTANPYLAGWVAALMCYPPFILMDQNGVLNYHVNTSDWAYWFEGHTKLLYVWGGVLVLLTAMYAWATVAFGPRFSNLTHRGILTHGPYSWTRHPAYVSKNIYWWLMYLPFLVTSNSITDAIRNTAIMALVSGIYYWRAKTEEKHLMADPVYAQYHGWMERNAPVPRFFAALKRAAGTRVRRGAVQAQTQVEPAE